MKLPPEGGSIETQGACTREGKPFVISIVNGEPFGQLTPREAIEMGTRFIQSAIEAERDAGTLKAMKKYALDSGDDEKAAEQFAASFIMMIREHRDQADIGDDSHVGPDI